MVSVADLPDRRHAVHQDSARLAGRQLDLGDSGILGDQLRRSSRTAHHLRTLAGTKLNIVNGGSERNVAQRKCVANKNVSVRTGHNLHAHGQAHRLQNVALLAVRIVQQRDARRAVRIVLDRRNFGRDAGLVALEIDDAILDRKSTRLNSSHT